MLKQSEWINHLLFEVEKNPTEDKIFQTECCGKGCAEQNGHLESAKALAEAAKGCKTRSDYMTFMQNNFPFKVEEASDGIIIHYGKEKCTCPMSPEVKSPMLCNCTLGHEKAMWSIIFGKQVDAEIIDSFQRGGNDCVVKILL